MTTGLMETREPRGCSSLTAQGGVAVPGDVLPDKLVSGDVLVIGSGGAGARAAIEAASSNDLKVIMVTKGRLAKCGATVTAAAGIAIDSKSVVELFGLDGDLGDSPSLFLEDIVIGGKYLSNQKMAEVHVTEGPSLVRELANWGMKVDGLWHASGHRYPRVIRSTGVRIMRALTKRVNQLRDNIHLVEDTMVTDLLTDGRRVVGAVGLDLTSGRTVLFRAKAVVLATGGGQRVYACTTAPDELTGDGYAMALRAGAQLIDMEFVQFITSTFIHPPNAVIPVDPILSLGPWLLNNKGQRFMRRWDPEAVEGTTRDKLAVGIMTEILEGRGWRGEEGGYVYLSMCHLPGELLEHYARTQAFFSPDFYRSLGRKALKCFPASHFFCGGVRVNENAETSVEGLYAAGEVSGGLNGANRIGGNAITQILVQGRQAGRSASTYARQVDFGALDTWQISEYCERILRPMRRRDGVRPIDIRKRIQKMAWECAGVVRNAAGLKSVVAELEKIRNEELPDLFVTCKDRVFNREWVEALQLTNMTVTLEMISRAALMRTESRGTHYRRDCPVTDNTRWIRNIVVHDRDGRMHLESVPAIVSRIRPEMTENA